MRITLPTSALTILLAATAPSQAQVGGKDIEPAHRMNVESARTSFLEANPQSSIAIRDGIISRVYGKAFSNGVNPLDSATRFLEDNAHMFGVESGELLPIGPNAAGIHVLPLGFNKATGTNNFSLVAWTQALDGIPVYNGSIRVLVRNEAGFPAVLVSNEMADMHAYEGQFVGQALTPTQLDPRTYTRHAANQFFMEPVFSGAEQVIWAGKPGAWVDPTLAVTFVATGGTRLDPMNYQKFRYVVDASNGRILDQENMILDLDVSGTVAARVTQGDGSDNCGDEISEPLPYARLVTPGATNYADANGNFILFGNNTQTVTSAIAGRYFVVNDEYDGSVSTETATLEAGVPYTFNHNSANANEYDRAEVNSYLWANRTRDWALSHFPSMPTISSQLSWPININLGSSCNAFYDYSSINFYTSGNGCPNTAFSDVVAHEYGHHMIAVCGSGQGQYGEGGSDCNGIILTREPILGNGFLGNCSEGIRNADNDKQYPQTGAIHDSGQLMSGCVWDVILNFGGPDSDEAIDKTSYLWVNSICLHTGDLITPDITIDFLTLDDNDGNIYNGTPNYYAINDAFSQHNMPGPDLQLLEITLPEGAPDSVAPSGTSFPVSIQDLTGEYQTGTAALRFRVGSSGSFTAASLTDNGGGNFTASLPATECGNVWEFYISAETTSGIEETLPVAAPGSSVFSAPVATGFETILDLDFETNPGWSVTGVSGAAVGEWAIGTPCGTTTRGAPGDDYDGSGQCYLTGVGTCDSNTDVDDGCATLTTAAFSAVNSEGAGDATVTYALWYDNTGGGIGADPSNDIMTVEISTNGGTTWTNIETIGPLDSRSSGGWFSTSFQVSSYGTPSENCLMRFEACDANSGSVIEAAVDAFSVEVVLCDEDECPGQNLNGDVNDDGTVDGEDLSILLGFWGTDYPFADFNCDGMIDGEDLSVCLGNWTAP
ncbi:MAG: hypothetical protein MK082_10375 [Phycisphaerales bacterium]|nr:hypothetical protein [Phycisphaerales bacterium]